MKLLKRITAVSYGALMTMHYTSRSLAGEIVEPLAPHVAAAEASAKELPAERQKLLRAAADAIAEQLRKNEKSQLVFICTANSRRSQLSQVWAKVAAAHCGLDDVETYSGGTEASACNPRTVKALRRAGLSVISTTSGENPHYLVQFADSEPALELFSKHYSATENPQQDFVAMMCCSDADEACPVVKGAAARVRLNYEDPKRADGTPEESAAYDERSRQIAAEMFFLMGHVAERR